MSTYNEILENLPDDSFNLIRLVKVIKGCNRCMDKWEEMGGLRLTLTEENDRDVKTAYQKWK